MVRAPQPPSARRRPFRPRRWAVLLLALAALAVVWHLFLPAGPFPTPSRRVILIQRGQSVHQIAAELVRVGLMQGTLGFEVLARAMRLDRHIQAGQYAFKLGTSVPSILRALARGMSGLNLVTIPEGLTTAEVAHILSEHLGVPAAAFDSLAHDRAFLDTLGVPAPSIEGWLAPDTYEFLPGTAPEVAFRTMVRRTQAILLDAAAGRDSLPLGLTLKQILALASIVESEAQHPEERARIARVYLNRLQIGMRLQADPTVAFGEGRPPRTRLYLRDLQSPSPYNTYLHEGLPPGPICNPGRSSIEASLNPTEGLADLYFVSRGDGRHLFARTYAAHLQNIQAAHAMIAARAAADSESLAVAARLDTARVARAPTPVSPPGKPESAHPSAADKPTTSTTTAAKPPSPAASKAGTSKSH